MAFGRGLQLHWALAIRLGAGTQQQEAAIGSGDGGSKLPPPRGTRGIKTAVQYVHDGIVNATGGLCVACLLLLRAVRAKHIGQVSPSPHAFHMPCQCATCVA